MKAMWEKLGLPSMGKHYDNGARDAIKAVLSEHFREEVLSKTTKHHQGFLTGKTNTLKTDVYAAEVEGTKNYELAKTHKDDLPAMMMCCRAEIEMMASTGVMAAPFYFKRVFILAHKQKMYELEKWACDTIISLCELHDKAHKEAGASAIIAKGMPAYREAKARLPKVKELLKAQKSEKPSV